MSERPGEPFVSVVTPVYNGAADLAQCIESVMNQKYANFEYIIVNNRSTDETLGIAESYARKDARIRVFTTESFVNAEENHNNGFRLVSPRSSYCKVVSADDWLLPHCLTRMLQLAVSHPAVGIVGSYQRCGEGLKWRGLPESVSVLSGREVCRLGLLNDVHVLGNPTSSLYRTDLIRRTASFFPHAEAHADTSACYAHLHDCDYGFVHEALSVERTHPGQLSNRAAQLHAGDLAYVEILLRYGPLYLSEEEHRRRLDEVFDAYYRVLGRCVVKLKGREFWRFHRKRMRELGYPLRLSRLVAGACAAFGRAALRPGRTMKAMGTMVAPTRHHD